MLYGGTLFHIYNTIITWNYQSDYMEGGGLFFYFLTLGFTLFLSIPYLIVFVVTYNILSNTKLSNSMVKLILSIICLVGCSVWFYMLFDVASPATYICSIKRLSLMQLVYLVVYYTLN